MQISPQIRGLAAPPLAMVLIVYCCIAHVPAQAAIADEAHRHPQDGAVDDDQDAAPVAPGRTAYERIIAVLLLQDPNTRVVLLGTVLLGVSAGAVGVFMLLRKRALIGDVVGHSALPGIAIAFLVMELATPGSGKSLGGLLTGAFLAGLTGAAAVLLIDHYSRIKHDAALAIVLSIFYGVGAALFTIVQRVPGGNAAGLEDYLNGKTASLLAGDVMFFALAAILIAALTLALFKEITVLCFDQQFAAAEGWPVFLLDVLLVGMVVGVTTIGMQSVGLILVVAILIVPAVAARFWTEDIRWMTLLAALFGGLGSGVGIALSAVIPKLAAGATIVLADGAIFIISLLFGRRRGVVKRKWEQRRSQRRIGQADLLRAIYEHLEPTGGVNSDTPQPVLERELKRRRSWSDRRLRRLLRQAERDGALERVGPGAFQLTETGRSDAKRATRNHRLWETYLIEYADIAPSHVDRDADRIEHILDKTLIAELQRLMEQRFPPQHMPGSPHAL